MRRLSIIIGALGLLLLAGCGSKTPTTTSDNAIQTYKSASGFSLQYPKTRTYQENVYGALAMFFTPKEGTGDAFNENVSVVSEILPSDMTVDEYFALVKPQLESVVKDYKELSNENITINKVTAKKLIYQGIQSNYTLKREQVFFIKNKVAYVITYTAAADTFAEYSTQVDALANSFTTTK